MPITGIKNYEDRTVISIYEPTRFGEPDKSWDVEVLHDLKHLTALPVIAREELQPDPFYLESHSYSVVEIPRLGEVVFFYSYDDEWSSNTYSQGAHSVRGPYLLVSSKSDIISVEFDIKKPVLDTTIIVVSGFVERKLIEFFQSNPQELRVIDRRLFEELIAELFHGFGYEVELTQQTHDGGKDIIAIRNIEVFEKFLIECKRPDPRGYVGIGPIRELYGVKVSEGATKGILATTAHFSRTAQSFLEEHKWELEGKDFDDLRVWIERYLKTGAK